MILSEINCGKIIFGSYAKNINTKDSDLDIILLSKEDKKINEIINKSSIEIHTQFSTKNELRKRLNDGDTLAIEIAKNHIILSNFDDLVKIFMEHYTK